MSLLGFWVCVELCGADTPAGDLSMSSYFGSLFVSSVSHLPTMAIVACRQLPFPLDACLTVESFVWQYHHLAFLERYGRAMPCVKMDWPETSYLPPAPGFTTTAWYVRPRNYGHLAWVWSFCRWAFWEMVFVLLRA